MRRLALIAALIVGGASALAATAVGEDSHTYFMEIDNAFGIVTGSEVKVAGVTTGLVNELFINSKKRAVVKITLTGELSELRTETICSAEPQSLIAEYFIDCNPKGAPLAENTGSDEERIENPDIPVEQTRQTVQSDLVQSGLRQSYKERLQLIINEFGTALAGNPDNLNDAIRRGAPALTQARRLTKILADQNTIIRDLQSDSDAIFIQLADRRRDVVRFVENARDAGAASAERRTDLSRNFEILDDFLAELQPTMANLNELAVSQTPLLRDLRLAAPDLKTLSRKLPAFNSASTKSLKSLAGAAKVGERALRKGADEINQLKASSKRASSVADHLVKFLRDVDDPGRAVAEDTRVQTDTDRSGGGYTGLEGLLNYLYYQAGALNQFDEVSHLLHFSIFELENTPCSSYNPANFDDEPGTVPAADGTPTTDFDEIHRCVAWLGPNQPGINSGPQLDPYSGEACADGSESLEICDPSVKTSAPARGLNKAANPAAGARGKNGKSGIPGLGDLGGGSGSGDGGNGGARDALPGLGEGLNLPEATKGIRGLPKLGRGSSGSRGSSGATRDLLGFLFDD